MKEMKNRLKQPGLIHISGAPGTGKSTNIINMIKELIEEGYYSKEQVFFLVPDHSLRRHHDAVFGLEFQVTDCIFVNIVRYKNKNFGVSIKGELLPDNAVVIVDEFIKTLKESRQLIEWQKEHPESLVVLVGDEYQDSTDSLDNILSVCELIEERFEFTEQHRAANEYTRDWYDVARSFVINREGIIARDYIETYFDCSTTMPNRNIFEDRTSDCLHICNINKIGTVLTANYSFGIDKGSYEYIGHVDGLDKVVSTTQRFKSKEWASDTVKRKAQAIAIYSSQGFTTEEVYMYIYGEITDRQFYTGISRVRDIKNVHFIWMDDNTDMQKFKADTERIPKLMIDKETLEKCGYNEDGVLTSIVPLRSKYNPLFKNQSIICDGKAYRVNTGSKCSGGTKAINLQAACDCCELLPADQQILIERVKEITGTNTKPALWHPSGGLRKCETSFFIDANDAYKYALLDCWHPITSFMFTDQVPIEFIETHGVEASMRSYWLHKGDWCREWRIINDDLKEYMLAIEPDCEMHYLCSNVAVKKSKVNNFFIDNKKKPYPYGCLERMGIDNTYDVLYRTNQPCFILLGCEMMSSNVLNMFRLMNAAFLEWDEVCIKTDALHWNPDSDLKEQLMAMAEVGIRFKGCHHTNSKLRDRELIDILGTEFKTEKEAKSAYVGNHTSAEYQKYKRRKKNKDYLYVYYDDEKLRGFQNIQVGDMWLNINNRYKPACITEPIEQEQEITAVYCNLKDDKYYLHDIIDKLTIIRGKERTYVDDLLDLWTERDVVVEVHDGICELLTVKYKEEEQ